MNELTRLWGSARLVDLVAFSLKVACVNLCSLAVRSIVMRRAHALVGLQSRMHAASRALYCNQILCERGLGDSSGFCECMQYVRTTARVGLAISRSLRR